MKTYIELIQRYRKPLFALLIMINIFALIGLTRIHISSDFQIFVPTDSVYKDKLDEMDTSFPSADQLLIQFEMDETKVSMETYTELADFYKYIDTNYKGVTVNGSITSTDTGAINEQSLAILEKQIEGLGDLSTIKVKDQKMYHIYTLFSEEPLTHDNLNDIESYMTDAGLTYAISGNTYIQLKVLDYIIFILTRVPPLALITLLIVFNFQIRSKKGTILSVLPAGIGALWTLGIVGWIGEPVSILTVLAPIFAIVIGSADGLHFIAHVQEEQVEHGDTKLALTNTLKMVGVPMIITTVTSMAGFLSLLVMNTEAIKGLAIFASLGIMLAGIATWYILPLILSGGLILHGKVHKDRILKKGLRRFWGLPSIGVAVVVIAIFIVGAGQVKQEFNMLSIYRSYTEVSQNNEIISEVNGGTLPVFIYGDIPADTSLEQMGQDILALEDGLRQQEGVGKVVSAFDFMSLMNDPSMAASIDQSLLSEFVNIPDMKFKIMVFPTVHENAILQNLDDYIGEQENTLSAYNMQVTGASFMMMELNESMLVNQLMSSALAMVIVFLLLLIALRQVRSALASLIPIVMTLLFLFGFLGLTGISLNIITCTIFSITVGVGIDYAIHFTSIWRVRVKEGMSSEEAADLAYYYTARPILANAFGLSLGFTALMLSPLQIHMTVSILMWASMMVSVVFSLIILPSILRRIK
ncbi:MAG: MMPL family transporter [Vallitaleaceae bacterium]|jgi:predicted RND superfamily exporter protein|nr:MMPL family transporter [Vallitaleaceae bacterium]